MDDPGDGLRGEHAARGSPCNEESTMKIYQAAANDVTTDPTDLPDDVAIAAWVSAATALPLLAAELAPGAAVRWWRDAGDDDLAVCTLDATAAVREAIVRHQPDDEWGHRIAQLDEAISHGLTVLADVTLGRHVSDNCAPARASVALSPDGTRGAIRRRIGLSVLSEEEAEGIARVAGGAVSDAE